MKKKDIYLLFNISICVFTFGYMIYYLNNLFTHFNLDYLDCSIISGIIIFLVIFITKFELNVKNINRRCH